jgi:hypothetical protein
VRQAFHRDFLESARRPACRFFPAVKCVTEHFGDGGRTAEEMNLKTVRLLLGARACVDAADVCF